MCANGDIDKYNYFYNEIAESEAWDFLAISNAVNFIPS